MEIQKVAEKVSREYGLAYDINPDEQEHLEEIIVSVLTGDLVAGAGVYTAEVGRLRKELTSIANCIDEYYANDDDDIPVHDLLGSIRDDARTAVTKRNGVK